MNNLTIAAIVDDYSNGSSLTEVAQRYGVSVSTARRCVKASGSLRSKQEAARLAAEGGKMGKGFRGKQRTFSEEHCRNISAGRQKWGQENTPGFRITSHGYVEFTRGEYEGRMEHVVLMEKRIGRRLRPDECVHHVDGVRTNNTDDNLALMTRAGHSRLHRIQDEMAGKTRLRDAAGCFLGSAA